MKELFTTSYEEKRKNNLIELNDKYNKLLSTYELYNNNDIRDLSQISETENDIINHNKLLISELHKSADMLDTQINIYENKKQELDKIEKQILKLDEKDSDLNYSTNIKQLKKENNKNSITNLILLILCCGLIVILLLLNIM